MIIYVDFGFNQVSIFKEKTITVICFLQKLFHAVDHLRFLTDIEHQNGKGLV